MSHKTLWVSLSRGWLIHSDSHYSHRRRVNQLPSAKLEVSLSPPISFFPTWALSDGLADCTDKHNWALLRNQGHKSQNNEVKKILEKNFADILWTVTFSVPALKGQSNLFSFVHIQFFDFWVESVTPPGSFDELSPVFHEFCCLAPKKVSLLLWRTFWSGQWWIFSYI